MLRTTCFESMVSFVDKHGKNEMTSNGSNLQEFDQNQENQNSSESGEKANPIQLPFSFKVKLHKLHAGLNVQLAGFWKIMKTIRFLENIAKFASDL